MSDTVTAPRRDDGTQTAGNDHHCALDDTANADAPAASSSAIGAPTKIWRRLLSGNTPEVIWCLIDQGVVSAAGFATSVLIGRESRAELGIYYLALNLLLFVRGLQEPLISTPYMIYRHRYADKELPRYNGSCFSHQLILAACTVVGLLLLTAASATGLMSAQMAPTLLVVSILAPVMLMRELIRQFCFSHLRASAALGIDVVVTATQVSGLYLLAENGQLSAPNAYLIIGAACGIALLIWALVERPRIELNVRQIIRDWRQNWVFGKWAVSGQLVGSASMYITPWILLDAAGETGAGMFAAAFTLVGVTNIFIMGIANYLTPKAAEAYANVGLTGLSRVLGVTALIFLAALGSFLLFVVFAGGRIAEFVYGNEYTNLHLVMIILATSVLIRSFSIVASNGLAAMERIRDNLVADVFMTCVTLGAAVVLTYQYGVLGAAISSLLGAVSGTLARNFILLRLMRMEYQKSEAA